MLKGVNDNKLLYGGEMTTELVYFANLWETRGLPSVSRTPKIWDLRAEAWIRDLDKSGTGKRGMRERARHTANYLRSCGLLCENDTVVDVGCGPGLFVLEFAETAKSACGIDYSRRFLDYGAKLAQRQGVKNASFKQCDFFALDVEKAGLARKFDLVYTAITPAATGKGCLEKLMEMSRAYCSSTFLVHSSDSMAERVAVDVFHKKLPPHDGTGFYALVNLLWHRGYYPETSYYNEAFEEICVPDMKTAADCARTCGRNGEEDAREVLRYLEKLGNETNRRRAFRYGAVLWDTRIHDAR